MRRDREDEGLQQELVDDGLFRADGRRSFIWWGLGPLCVLNGGVQMWLGAARLLNLEPDPAREAIGLGVLQLACGLLLLVLGITTLVKGFRHRGTSAQ